MSVLGGVLGIKILGNFSYLSTIPLFTMYFLGYLLYNTPAVQSLTDMPGHKATMNPLGVTAMYAYTYGLGADAMYAY